MAVGRAQIKSFHPDELTRVARLQYAALLQVAEDESVPGPVRQLAERVLDASSATGLFHKPGYVLQGPIPGDIGGRPVTLDAPWRSETVNWSNFG